MLTKYQLSDDSRVIICG